MYASLCMYAFFLCMYVCMCWCVCMRVGLCMFMHRVQWSNEIEADLLRLLHTVVCKGMLCMYVHTHTNIHSDIMPNGHNMRALI